MELAKNWDVARLTQICCLVSPQNRKWNWDTIPHKSELLEETLPSILSLNPSNLEFHL